MGIHKTLDGTNIFTGPIKITPPKSDEELMLGTSKRVGITKPANEPLRFYLKGSNFISRI